MFHKNLKHKNTAKGLKKNENTHRAHVTAKTFLHSFSLIATIPFPLSFLISPSLSLTPSFSCSLHLPIIQWISCTLSGTSSFPPSLVCLFHSSISPSLMLPPSPSHFNSPPPFPLSAALIPSLFHSPSQSPSYFMNLPFPVRHCLVFSLILCCITISAVDIFTAD